MVSGNKILQQQTIDAIDKLIVENKTTQSQLKQLEDSLENRLTEILKESRIQNKHSEIMTDEVIVEDEVD